MSINVNSQNTKIPSAIQKMRSLQILVASAFTNSSPQLLRLAHPLARQPERFLVIQTTLPKSRHRIAQVRFQFASDFRRQVALRGQFLPPVFQRRVQIVTGLMFHNLLKVL